MNRCATWQRSSSLIRSGQTRRLSTVVRVVSSTGVARVAASRFVWRNDIAEMHAESSFLGVGPETTPSSRTTRSSARCSYGFPQSDCALAPVAPNPIGTWSPDDPFLVQISVDIEIERAVFHDNRCPIAKYGMIRDA
jgi:hypothetical protein